MIATRNEEIDAQRGRRSATAIYLMPIAVMIAIFAMSSRSKLPELGVGRDVQSVAGHFVAFGLLGISMLLVCIYSGMHPRSAFLTAILAATLYGITDEFHQSFVPGRTPDLFDIVTDVAGATSFALLALIAIKRPAIGTRPRTNRASSR